jgi:hypothetical protein
MRLSRSHSRHSLLLLRKFMAKVLIYILMAARYSAVLVVFLQLGSNSVGSVTM